MIHPRWKLETTVGRHARKLANRQMSLAGDASIVLFETENSETQELMEMVRTFKSKSPVCEHLIPLRR